jgi:hypothetical protein
MPEFSRRKFLSQSGSAFGASWLALSLPAILTSCERTWDAVDTEAGFTTLSPSEAADLKAMAAQIFPTTDTPGADEAGVIYFLDAAFATFFAGFLNPIRASLQSINENVSRDHDPATSYSTLSDTEQKAVMEEFATTPDFELVKLVVTCGMFSNPEYGGNRDKVGWSLLGFDDRHAWQHPFGYYDAEATGGE